MTTYLSARGELADKVKPELSDGDLVKVAGAQNQPQAELLQGLLLEVGVPSVLRRARGFDVPELLAAGPRDVLVPESGVQVARDVLLQADFGSVLPSSGTAARPVRLVAGVLIALVLGALVVFFLTELLA
jgi:hypothetical protein